MPLYMIERNFAETLEIPDAEGVNGVRAVNADEGIHWLFSFLSNDKRRAYCIYEAPNPAAILAAARRLDVPADVIIEVSEINPELISPAR
jgi:hypothetical protein